MIDMMIANDPNISRILIADDQPDIRKALSLLLKPHGYQIIEATSPSNVLVKMDERDFDLLLMDLNYTRDTTSGKEGLDLLSRIQQIDSTLRVVVMTAYGSIEIAVQAMRLGARDFIEKPWDNDRLLSILRTQIELGHALRKGRRLEAENRMYRDKDRPTLIAESKSMQSVIQLIAKVSTSDANVLITGENGTGKSLVARCLHADSTRSTQPMITVNVGSLSEGVFESELFGHVKGAFTDAKSNRIGRFELADGGTLFLDEIANVPISLQTKLLHVLETQQFERVGSSKTIGVDVRILSATNADIDSVVESGLFRQDLLYRLNTIEIQLPSLRDRREDIPLLAMHFLRLHTERYRKHIDRFDVAATQSLLDYSWPGNVRELDHMVERAVLMAQENMIQSNDLAIRSAQASASRIEDMTLDEVECYLIRKTLARYESNIQQTAKALGLSRSGLYRRLNKYGLTGSDG